MPFHLYTDFFSLFTGSLIPLMFVLPIFSTSAHFHFILFIAGSCVLSCMCCVLLMFLIMCALVCVSCSGSVCLLSFHSSLKTFVGGCFASCLALVANLRQSPLGVSAHCFLCYLLSSLCFVRCFSLLLFAASSLLMPLL